MKITRIIPYPARVGTRNQLLVKVETDEGLYGWGESGLQTREKAVIGMIEHFAQFVVGRDPMQIGAIWQEMYRSQYFEGGRVITSAMSAIDIALHDIKGKALGVPVYELLGGKQRDRIPTFASTFSSPGPAMIEEARRLVELGWTAIRLTPSGHNNSGEAYDPRAHIANSAEWCIRSREALGDDVVLGLDYHHRLSVAEAASFCQKMPRGTLDFLEEPIRAETPSAYEALRRLTDIPFAIGEVSSKWQFAPYIEQDIHQFNRIDVCNVGGLTEAMKVAGWSEAHYVDMMPHNPLGSICTAATVHFAAAVPNFAWLETFETPDGIKLGSYSDDIFPVRIRLADAHYPVPTGPGLGIEVNEDYVKSLTYDFFEFPHLKRSDGSVTNW